MREGYNVRILVAPDRDGGWGSDRIPRGDGSLDRLSGCSGLSGRMGVVAVNEFNELWKDIEESHKRTTRMAIAFVILGWCVTLAMMVLVVTVVTHFVWGWP